MRLDVLRFAQIRGLADQFDELVETCMSDYDLYGWTDDTWC
jgi:4-hydroxyphenylacetate 3-monooxygenase